MLIKSSAFLLKMSQNLFFKWVILNQFGWNQQNCSILCSSLKFESAKKHILGKNGQVNLIEWPLYGFKFARKIKVQWPHATLGTLGQFLQKNFLEISKIQAH